MRIRPFSVQSSQPATVILDASDRRPMGIEREVPDPGRGYYVDHFARYRFAMGWVMGKAVLDVGCGTGYGADVMATAARSVVGLDMAEEAIRHAISHYRRPNLRYLNMDCRALGFRDASFDVVTSFEVFEHLSAEDAEPYLQVIIRVLRRGGTALVSTPNGPVETASFAGAGFNPFHLNLLAPGAFRRLLRRFFPEVALYGQRRNTPALLTLLKWLDVFNLRLMLLSNGSRERMLSAAGGKPAVPALADIVIRRSMLRQSRTIIAICRWA